MKTKTANQIKLAYADIVRKTGIFTLSVSNVEMLNAAHDRVFISGFAVHPMTSSSLLSQNTLMLELVPVM